MTAEEWLDLDATEEKSKKGYAHFDRRTSMREKKDYVFDPANIAHHGFYPFIHYKKKQIKYSKKKGKKVKERDICYAAHIDRCIYQYYSFLLGEQYNQRVAKDGISQCAVAYRTDLGQNNIHFAKRAIDFIRTNAPCYVMIGDFTHFFDSLDHRYLKQQWCSLLEKPELPRDHYQVFKSVTHYSTWELSDLLELNRLKDTRAGRRALNEKMTVLTPEQFKINRKHIQKHEEPFGIPQGSPISGLLANVYMLEVDKEIHDLVVDSNGLYMRYSDDFIVVLPDEGSSTHKTLGDISTRFNAIVGLKLEPEKTQYFKFEDQMLKNCGAEFSVPGEGQKRYINFLGFTFDGKHVSIRAKTTGKYYYRMYSKAKTVRRSKGKGRRVSADNLYALYSCKGARGYRIKGKDGKVKRGSGNFLSYVDRAKRTFGKDELIDRDTRRHMGKIKRALKE